jgi:hypothetical protein
VGTCLSWGCFGCCARWETMCVCLSLQTASAHTNGRVHWGHARSSFGCCSGMWLHAPHASLPSASSCTWPVARYRNLRTNAPTRKHTRTHVHSQRHTHTRTHAQGPYMYEVADTPLLRAVLSCACADASMASFVMAVHAMLMLLPCLGTRVAPLLPPLVAVWVRAVRWQLVPSQTHPPPPSVAGAHTGTSATGAGARGTDSPPARTQSPTPSAAATVDISEPATSPSTTTHAASPDGHHAARHAPLPAERVDGWEPLGTCQRQRMVAWRARRAPCPCVQLCTTLTLNVWVVGGVWGHGRRRRGRSGCRGGVGGVAGPKQCPVVAPVCHGAVHCSASAACGTGRRPGRRRSYAPRRGARQGPTHRVNAPCRRYPYV